MIKKVKNTAPWTHAISDFNIEEIVGTFGKTMIILLTVRLKRNILLCKMSYFPEPHTHNKHKIEVEIYLANYAVKSYLKNAAYAHTTDVAKKVGLASWKLDIDQLDIDKLEKTPSDLGSLKNRADKLDIDKWETTPIPLCKLSDVVKNNVVKITEYDKLIEKVNNIKTTDASNLVQNADC